MEFIKVGKNYMIKGSNGRIVSEKEKLQLENKELVLKDIKGCNCQKETTKKISKNKKRIKEIEVSNAKFSKEKIKPEAKVYLDTMKNVYNYETALNDEVQNDIIKETDTTI